MTATTCGTIPRSVAESVTGASQRKDPPAKADRVARIRAVRCRMLDERRNPCPNPQLTEFGLCMNHLHEAADEWQRVVCEVTQQSPGAIYDATASERGL